jgi:hypothetical protein
MIIVKNNIKLPLQKPLFVKKIFRKKKWLLDNRGFFIATVNLPSNAFAYSEEIEINIVIDNSQLNIDMHSINISLKNIIFKFQKESHLIHSKKENEI